MDATIRCCCLMHSECFILGCFGIQQRTFTTIINPVFYASIAVNIFARYYIMAMTALWMQILLGS